MQTIYVWPDGDWYFPDEVEYHAQHKSDDYIIVDEIPDDFSFEQVSCLADFMTASGM